jgi:hypothetical protein
MDCFAIRSCSGKVWGWSSSGQGEGARPLIVQYLRLDPFSGAAATRPRQAYRMLPCHSLQLRTSYALLHDTVHSPSLLTTEKPQNVQAWVVIR